jgi:acetyl-CoA carboxylase beta subunit
VVETAYTYEEACEEHRDVLNLLVKCKKCKKHLFCVYDSDVRDTCFSCGGFSKIVIKEE